MAHARTVSISARLVLAGCIASLAGAVALARPQAPVPDRTVRAWVDRTLAQLSVQERIGQLVMPGMDTTYLSTDSDEFERLTGLVERERVGGFVVFGGSEAVPGVLLNPAYGPIVLGDPLSAAATLNALQQRATVPLLNAGDFEFGVGMRIRGATQFPRAMAFGAAGDPALAEEAGRITAIEMRALGVHVNFAPVADVNNNPRNPVINTRSFGEDPARVGTLANAFARGLARGGVLATLKHFPGHGDTDVDTHLGLATVPHPRERLDAVELAPFRAGIAAGVPIVMVGHLAMPGIGDEGLPATLSARASARLLREELGFSGLVVTDSLKMHAITQMFAPGEAAVRAIEAGNDIVLDPPDPPAALAGLGAAAESGRLTAARIEASARRVLEAKARVGLREVRTVPLDAVADRVGGRAHRAVAQAIADRAVTLVRDTGNLVPVGLPRERQVLYLSVLDYPSGWRNSAPARTFLPELRSRWPSLTAIELSDRSTAAEIDLVRASAARYDAIVIGVFARAASGSGRIDLAPELARLLNGLGRSAGARPVVAALFGNPYVAASLADVPALLLTYDFGDAAERAAVRALAGEIPVGGRLPIAIPGLAGVGEGLTRPAR